MSDPKITVNQQQGKEFDKAFAKAVENETFQEARNRFLNSVTRDNKKGNYNERCKRKDKCITE